MVKLTKDFKLKFGPWAVVTGASSGIGEAFAKILAANGLSVVLTARREDRLKKLAESLAKEHDIETRVIVADLSTAEGPEQIASQTADLDVGLLINNAAIEVHGSMFRQELEKHQQVINVNVCAVTTLAYRFGRRFADKNRGGIIFVSSVGADALPWTATYTATKSFVSTMSYALRSELADKGVSVLALEPGLVESEMSAGADDVDFKKFGMPKQSAERCAGVTLKCLARNRLRTTPGRRNTMAISLLRFLPKRMGMSLKTMNTKRAMSPESLTYK